MYVTVSKPVKRKHHKEWERSQNLSRAGLWRTNINDTKKKKSPIGKPLCGWSGKPAGAVTAPFQKFHILRKQNKIDPHFLIEERKQIKIQIYDHLRIHPRQGKDQSTWAQIWTNPDKQLVQNAQFWNGFQIYNAIYKRKHKVTESCNTIYIYIYLTVLCFF